MMKYIWYMVIYQIMEPNIEKYLEQQGFTIGRKVGFGLTSEVYHLAHDSGRQYALKCIRYNSQQMNKVILQAELECHLLRDFSHPGIISNRQTLTFPDQTLLLLEYCSRGSMVELERYFLHNKDVRDKKHQIIPYYITQIASILLYLKKMCIIHRDLKLQNFVFTSDFKLKLIDFGSSKVFPGENLMLDGKIIENDQKLNSEHHLVGSRHYFAPEVIGPRSQRKITFQLDVWCLGILAYKLYTGTFPFTTNKTGHFEIFQKIREDEVKIPEYLQEEVKQFLRKCLQKDPSERITIEEILSLPLLQKYRVQDIFDQPSPLDKIINPESYKAKKFYQTQCKLKQSDNKFKQGTISINQVVDTGHKCLKFVPSTKKSQKVVFRLNKLHFEKDKKDILRIQDHEGVLFYLKFSDEEKRDGTLETCMQILKH